jgi:hypothetical protein
MSSADDFLKEQSENNPERYKEVSDRYSTLSPYGEKEFYYDKLQGTMIDHSPEHRQNKRRKYKQQQEPEQPRSRRLDPQEWAEYRKSKAKYEREWLEDFYYAKELADEAF